MSVATAVTPLDRLGDLIRADSASALAPTRQMLRIARQHLDLEIAFVSEFVDGRRVFRAVDSDLDDCPIREGDSNPLDDSFCGSVVDGSLPRLMTDAGQHPVAAAMPVTSALPVGAHVSVPVTRRDGSVFGTFCCFSRRPEPSLRQRDLSVVQLIADLLAPVLETERESLLSRDALVADLIDVCRGGPKVVIQPIVEMATRRPVGYEALARFPPSDRTPEQWFAEAQEVGWGTRLEVAAIRAALEHLPLIPTGRYLSVNTSAATLTCPELAELLAGHPLHQVVFEITEHTSAHDFGLDEALPMLRLRGARVAVDDAGSGYAGLRQILELRPDILKLDMRLVRGIDHDAARQALASALGWFAGRTGATVVAEGVETARERDSLRGLGVSLGQGYLFGRPAPAHQAVHATERHSCED
jgi:EAL domain-containing protein (putative c-di-GMP-specific phosphodiesterase class I)